MGHWKARTLGSALFAGVMAMAALCGRAAAQPVTTDFTYQGELRENGELADGVYDFRFRIYASASGPDPAYQIVCADDIEVVGGRFAAQLNFSHLLFQDFEVLYLELEVRPGDVGSCADPSGFETLAGRTLITPTPYALASLSAASAASANALSGVPAGSFARRDQPNTFASGSFFAGLGVTGSLTVTQDIAANSLVAQQGIAALAPQGAAPLAVISTTKVNNLNVDMLDGIDSPLFARRDQANTFVAGNSFAGLQVNGDLTASQSVFANSVVSQQTVAALAPQGTAPLIVASSFKVNNLNVDMLDGVDSPQFARRDQANAFGPNNTFAGLGVTGDVNASGNLFVNAILALDQIYAIAPNGTAPFVVGSTTKVTNLNADMLDGIIGAGYARIGAPNNFANDNTFINVNILGNFTGDTVAANVFALRSPATRSLILPACAFQTDGAAPVLRGAHELRGTTSGTTVTAFAPVQLPHGAKLVSISLNAYDIAPADLTLTLKSAAYAAVPVDSTLATLSSFSTFPNTTTYTHDFATPFPVIDNTNSMYFLTVTIPVPTTPANLRLGDVRITYTVDSIQP